MRRAGDHRRIAQAEEADDVLAHMGRRRGGERHDRRRAERAQALAELQVGGAEVVAPLGDAVRLVDRGEADAATCAAPRWPSSEPSVSGVVITSSEPPRAIRSSASRRALPRTVPSRRTHGNLALEQLLVLIAQQREQRRDQHHRLGQDHRRDLVAGRLAEAGRQHHQQVLAGHGVGDHPLLLGVEPRDPEAAGAELDRRQALAHLGGGRRVARRSGAAAAAGGRRARVARPVAAARARAVVAARCRAHRCRPAWGGSGSIVHGSPRGAASSSISDFTSAPPWRPVTRKRPVRHSGAPLSDRRARCVRPHPGVTRRVSASSFALPPFRSGTRATSR